MTPPGPAADPSPRDVLRLCAGAAPGLWFPADFAGPGRERLDEPLWKLRQAGLVSVGDWRKGRGQGFRLTPAGEKALNLADPLAAPAPPPGAFPKAVPRRPPKLVAVPTLVFLNAAWFAAGLLAAIRAGVPASDYLGGSGSPAMLELAIRLGAAYAPAMAAGEWWRLGSSLFVHFGLVHLLMNMFVLAALGGDAERAYGPRRFLLIYFAAGLGGNCFALGAFPSPNAVLAGASGAVWGAMVTLLVWLVQFRDRLPPGEARNAIRGMVLVLLMNAAFSAIPGISWQAHFGGGVAGGAVAALMGWEVRRPRAKPFARLLAAGVVAAGPALLAWQAGRGDGWRVVRELARPAGDHAGSPLLEALRGADLPHARAAANETTEALVTRFPKLREGAKASVARFRASVARAAELAPEGMPALTDYLDAAGALGDELQALLDAGALPEVADWERMEAKADAATAAWRALAAPAAR